MYTDCSAMINKKFMSIFRDLRENLVVGRELPQKYSDAGTFVKALLNYKFENYGAAHSMCKHYIEDQQQLNPGQHGAGYSGYVNNYVNDVCNLLLAFISLDLSTYKVQETGKLRLLNIAVKLLGSLTINFIGDNHRYSFYESLMSTADDAQKKKEIKDTVTLGDSNTTRLFTTVSPTSVTEGPSPTMTYQTQKPSGNNCI